MFKGTADLPLLPLYKFTLAPLPSHASQMKFDERAAKIKELKEWEFENNVSVKICQQRVMIFFYDLETTLAFKLTFNDMLV